MLTDGIYHLEAHPEHGSVSMLERVRPPVRTLGPHLICSRVRVFSPTDLLQYTILLQRFAHRKERSEWAVGWEREWPRDVKLPVLRGAHELATSLMVVLVTSKTKIPAELDHPLIHILRRPLERWSDHLHDTHYYTAYRCLSDIPGQTLPPMPRLIVRSIDSKRAAADSKSRRRCAIMAPTRTVATPVFEGGGTFIFVDIEGRRFPCGFPDLEELAGGKGFRITGAGGGSEFRTDGDVLVNEHPVTTVGREEREETGVDTSPQHVVFTRSSVDLARRLGLDVDLTRQEREIEHVLF